MAVVVAMRLDSFDQANFDKDPTLHGARFVTWTSAELSYSIISATIPILKPFVNNLSTNYGGGAASSSNGYGSGYAGRSTGSNLRATQDRKAGSQSFRMTRLGRGKDDAMRSSRAGGISARRNSDSGEHSLVQTPNGIADNDGVRPASKDGASVESEGSQRRIIRKDVTWHVERDGMGM